MVSFIRNQVDSQIYREQNPNMGYEDKYSLKNSQGTPKKDYVSLLERSILSNSREPNLPKSTVNKQFFTSSPADKKIKHRLFVLN
jgi:hypothetical protein